MEVAEALLIVLVLLLIAVVGWRLWAKYGDTADPRATPYNWQFVGLVGAPTALRGSAPFSVAAWDAATAAANPGVALGAPTGAVTLVPGGAATLTVAYPAALSYTYAYPVSVLEPGGAAPRATGDTRSVTWTLPIPPYGGSAPVSTVYVSELAGAGDLGGGFAEAVSDAGASLTNWTAAYLTAYQVLPLGGGGDGDVYAAPYAALAPGTSAPVPPRVGSGALALYLTAEAPPALTPGATLVFDVVAAEWPAPPLTQNPVMATLSTANPAAGLWYDGSTGQVATLYGDYVFLTGGASCYSELRGAGGAPLADPATGRTLGVGAEETVAWPRAPLVAAGALTPWGTPPETDDMGPLCAAGTTCQNLEGQEPCAALAAPYSFPTDGGAVYFVTGGAVQP